MGFFDKVGAGVKNTNSKIDESVNINKINTKIQDEKNSINGNYVKIGELYYKCQKGTDSDFDGKTKDMVASIDASNAKIADYEKQIEAVKSNAAAEREANKKAAEDADKKE